MSNQNDWDKALEEMKRIEESLHASDEQPSRRQRRLILFVSVMVVIIGIVVSFILSSVADSSPPQPPPQVIEADPMRFDPQMSLETVQQFAGDNLRFLGLEMTTVRSDGTVNFSTGDHPTVQYMFVAVDERQIVQVNVNEDLTMTRTTRYVSPADAIPDRIVPPLCDIPQLWQLAKSYNVPDNSVADIVYDENGYRFAIPLVEIDLQFNENCLLVRN